MATFGTLGTLVVIYTGFMNVPPLLPVMVVFVGFMASTGFRNVAFNTLTSRIPRPAERARFMSLQSAVQHAAEGGTADWGSERVPHGKGGQRLFVRGDGRC